MMMYRLPILSGLSVYGSSASGAGGGGAAYHSDGEMPHGCNRCELRVLVQRGSGTCQLMAICYAKTETFMLLNGVAS